MLHRHLWLCFVAAYGTIAGPPGGPGPRGERGHPGPKGDKGTGEETKSSRSLKASRLSVLCAYRWSGTARVTRTPRVVHCSNSTQSAEESRRSVSVSQNRVVNLQHHKSADQFLFYRGFFFLLHLQAIKRGAAWRSLAVAPAVAKGQTC